MSKKAKEEERIKVGDLTGTPAPKPAVKAVINPEDYKEFVEKFMESSYESIIVESEKVKVATLRSCLRKAIKKLGYNGKLRTSKDKEGKLYLVKV